MYSNYNKNQYTATRLGNWQEELALKDLTGYNRAAGPKDPNFTRQQHLRVVDHTDKVEAADYISTQAISHKEPSQFKLYVQPASNGVRSKSKMDQWKAEVEDEFKQREADRLAATKAGTFVSHKQEQFVAAPKETYLAARGFKVLRPKDPEDPVPKMEEQPYHAGETITMYTDALNGNTGRFPMTFRMNSTNGFLRSSAFTNDIRDSAKYNCEAHESL